MGIDEWKQVTAINLVLKLINIQVMELMLIVRGAII